eukprot:1063066-Pelagomonas_calceolata.AAC.4
MDNSSSEHLLMHVLHWVNYTPVDRDIQAIASQLFMQDARTNHLTVQHHVRRLGHDFPAHDCPCLHAFTSSQILRTATIQRWKRRLGHDFQPMKRKEKSTQA